MTNSVIFTAALVCFALILLIIAVSVLNNKGKNRLEGYYTNDQIYVGNLPYHVSENDLKSYFSRFGVIETIKVVRNCRTGRSKGYAFVTYTNAKQALKALNAHGKDLQGRSLVVRIAKSKEQHVYI